MSYCESKGNNASTGIGQSDTNQEGNFCQFNLKVQYYYSINKNDTHHNKQLHISSGQSKKIRIVSPRTLGRPSDLAVAESAVVIGSLACYHNERQPKQRPKRHRHNDNAGDSPSGDPHFGPRHACLVTERTSYPC